MNANTLLETSAWKQFEKKAREHARDPEEMVVEYINRCLELWADEALDDEVGEEARARGYVEEDAVDLVLQYRREKRDESAAS